MRTSGIRLSMKSPCREHPGFVCSDAARRYLRGLLTEEGVRTRYALAGTLRAVVLISVLISGLCHADACPVGSPILDDDVAAMVCAVRQSEQWIHSVDSLYLRIESVWTKPCACGADVGAGPRACPDGTTQTQAAVPTAKGLLEYASTRTACDSWTISRI